MPAVECPGCERVIDLDYEDMTTLILCKRCQTPFCPVTGAVMKLREESPAAPVMPSRNHEEGFGFRCPFCGSPFPPIVKGEITVAGWYLFVVLLSSCFLIPLCWVPLLICRREHRHCSGCGIRLDHS